MEGDMLDICLLGTGGMMPLPHRWLTSLMARYNGKSILIDCGEGTQIAMKEKGWSPKPIDVICFTHFHADHISGLPGMLLTMGNAERTEPLLLIGPRGLTKVVNSLRVIAPELPFEIICLEITESAAIRIKDTLLENMRVLMDYGVKFALDDFGNGESNLNYIVDMPVSIVKFDRDMSQAYFANQKARFVMEAAMHMIHDMKLEIVSEGIETQEQAQAIETLGIEYIQGYYFSKPLSGEEFLRLTAGAREREAM